VPTACFFAMHVVSLLYY